LNRISHGVTSRLMYCDCTSEDGPRAPFSILLAAQREASDVQLTPVSYSVSVIRLWTRHGYSMFCFQANKSDQGEALSGVFSMQERHIQ
jgi:hypothetical protein